jgi:hypothetical protein
MSLTLALGSVSSALAKSSTPAHAVSAPAHVAPISSVRPPAKNTPVAHAAGHKIA